MQDLPRRTTVGYSKVRLGFDRRTGKLVDCCGANVDGATDARLSGIDMFWPLGVHKKTYPVFDTATKKVWPATYDGEQSMHGLRVYRFVQHIPDTVMAAGSAGMPGRLLGLTGKAAAATVQVDRHYQADNVFWAEPRTGVSVDVQQNVRTTMLPKQGPGRLVVAALDLRMSKATVRSSVDKAEFGHRSLALLAAAKIGGVILGACLLATGPLLARRPAAKPRRGRDNPEDTLVRT